MAEPLELEVKADVRDAVRQLDRIERKLGDVGDATKETGAAASDGAGSWGNYSQQLTAATVGIQAGIAALNTLIDTTKKVAAEFERQAGIMNRFTGDISEAAERTKGLASNIDLMVASNRAAAAGLNLTAHEFANIAAVSEDFGAAMGESATQGMNSLIQAIATGRQGQLRKLGIDLTGITGLQNQQAEALRQLEEKYGDLTASADTLGGELAVLDTHLENAKTSFFEGLSASTGLTESFTELYDTITNQLLPAFGVEPGGIGHGIDQFVDLGLAAAAVIETIVQRVTTLTQAVHAFSNMNFERAIELGAQLADPSAFTDALARNMRENRLDAARRSGEQDARRRAGQAAGASRGGGGGGTTSRGSRGASTERVGMIGIGQFGGGDAVDMSEIHDESRLAEMRSHEKDMIGLRARALAQQSEQVRLLNEELQSRRDIQDALMTTAGMGEQVLELVGATDGQIELWRGASQIGQSIGSYPDPVGIAQHAIAAAIHFKNAADMGKGGGSAAVGTGGASGAGARPVAPAGARSGNQGGGTTVVNINAPTPAAHLGRDLMRAQRAAQRRFGT